MTFVITQTCCNDTACVAACPVGCIHPTADSPDHGTTEMLYIDPQSCIDCGACVDVCPVGAIHPGDQLPDSQVRYADINADYFRASSGDRLPIEPVGARRAAPVQQRVARVAVVGAGPSGLYVAEELMRRGIEVSMLDRLPTPFGLVRAGVAPDHPGTKGITDSFGWTMARPELHTYLNVELGSDIQHEDLAAAHHAVVYTVGASVDRPLGIPGEQLAGSHGAGDFVGWYNGHPDFSQLTFDLSHPRAVVVGNGNVALDIARVLVAGPEVLSRTDIADHALEALRRSNVREVVVLGRRGPSEAAFTASELLALGYLDGVSVTVDPRDLSAPRSDERSAAYGSRLKERILSEFGRPVRGSDRRIVLQFFGSPVELEGADRVQGLRVARNRLEPDPHGALVAVPTGEVESIETGLVLASTGFRGTPLAGLPFDDARGVVPSEGGRVVADPALRGVYVSGWIKRGPSGNIGTNKSCAEETVRNLLDDLDAGRLATPTTSRSAFETRLSERQPAWVGRRGWQSIDEHELAAGRPGGRPRVKVVDKDRLLRLT